MAAYLNRANGHPILLTSGSPFALWINPIHVLLNSGSPFALWISLIIIAYERLTFWALDEH